MKLLLLIFFFVLTVKAESADWLELSAEDGEYQVFIDRDTTVADKPIAEFWLKFEYKNLQKISESNLKFEKVLFHFLINCENSTEALDQEKYLREGVLVKSIRIPSEELIWKPVVPDTTNSLIMEKLCTNYKNQDQEQE